MEFMAAQTVNCIFTNLTPNQAKILAQWYEGQGEQNAYEWFAVQDEIAPLADVRRKGGYRETLPNGDIVVHCRTPERD